MFRLSQAILVAFAALLSLAAAQSTLPPCRHICHRFNGQCNVSLLDLSRTACFDTKTEQERTCDCGINTLQELAALTAGTVLRDCVIPRRLFNFGSSITVNAKLDNVHATGISNGGALRQNGDITRCTMCDWKCAGKNKFQNCVIAGSVTRSTFNLLSAEQKAILSIGGKRFARNTVKFMRTDSNMQIGCKDGFDQNKVGIMATPSFGRFSTVAGTKIRKNAVDQISFGAVSSSAIVDFTNTARIASAEGPCNVSGVVTPIKVTDFLAIPNGQCQKLFKKV